MEHFSVANLSTGYENKGAFLRLKQKKNLQKFPSPEKKVEKMGLGFFNVF